ncbi:MAG: hypothetical protein PHS57_00845 [Alphaproteobacteria bacterium]|nr:hypothetical protein [Alphaproteobacteria bacterium]
MSGFEKDHYSLVELADRWRLPFKDIEYHAEREHLEVQVWLGDVPVTRYVLKKTTDGEEIPVQEGIANLTGYFVVAGKELRKIFRVPGIPEIRQFHSLDRKEIYTLYPAQASCQINLSALEVSRVERDRFESNKKVCPLIVPENKTNIPSTSIGRPSVMKLVLQHFYERAKQGRLESTLKAEAVHLQSWARDKLGTSHAPAAKTIANNIRPIFKPHGASESCA